VNEKTDSSDEIVVSRMLRLFKDRGIACTHFNNHTQESEEERLKFKESINDNNKDKAKHSVKPVKDDAKDNHKDNKSKQSPEKGVIKDAKDINKVVRELHKENNTTVDVTSDTFLYFESRKIEFWKLEEELKNMT